jgi:2-polyprenyl-3-methyl-5-hydroxy-6-metoxy-1,4-benzoquinol methylase
MNRKRRDRGRTLARCAVTNNSHFINADIMTVPLDQTFDVVLCLNLLRHMQTIERVDTLLHKLYALANERLVLISPVF